MRLGSLPPPLFFLILSHTGSCESLGHVQSAGVNISSQLCAVRSSLFFFFSWQLIREQKEENMVDPWRALVREIIKRCRMIGSFQVQKTRWKRPSGERGWRLISHAPIARPVFRTILDGFRAIFNQAVRIKIQSSSYSAWPNYYFFLPVLSSPTRIR